MKMRIIRDGQWVSPDGKVLGTAAEAIAEARKESGEGASSERAPTQTAVTPQDRPPQQQARSKAKTPPAAPEPEPEPTPPPAEPPEPEQTPGDPPAPEQQGEEGTPPQGSALKVGSLPVNIAGAGKLKEAGILTFEALRDAADAQLTAAGLTDEQIVKVRAAAAKPATE